ncbi:MAG: hypothetical protein Kow0075_00720 [Salibacteraceae bacterium]
MRHLFTFVILFYSLSAVAQVRLTTASNVRMTINDIGTFGNGFRGSYDVLGYPSAEYPANSGIEHLFEAGIWVGALIDGSLTAVSTAAYDQSSGYSAGKAGYEFTTAAGSDFTTRSSLFDSPDFSPEAVSHQDFISVFTDSNILVPGTNTPIQNHQNPLNIEVRFESYNWNYSFSDFMIICNYTLTNKGADTLHDMYIGMWSNEVVRNTNITPAGQGGSSFYDKGGNGYIDTLYMAYCFDAAGDVGFTDSYIGHKFLGAETSGGLKHPAVDPNTKANYQCWRFNGASEPFFYFPTSDAERYLKMSSGMNHLECWDATNSTDAQCAGFQDKTIQEAINEPGNRSDLVSVGPFKKVAPGEQIKFAWAWIFAKRVEDGKPASANTPKQRQRLIENARWAQTAYNGEDVNFNGILDPGEDRDGDGRITRFILPTPPDIPKTRIVPKPGGMDIYWSDNAEKSVDPISQEQDFEGYKVYMTSLGDDVAQNFDLNKDLNLIATFDLPGNNLFYDTGLGLVELEDPVQFEGDTNFYKYRYTIDGLVNGWQYAVSLTAFDRGDEENNLEPLESSVISNTYRVFPGTRPNPNFEQYATRTAPVKAILKDDLKDSLEKYAPFVYPNPYYGGASWEGRSTFEEDRKVVFANLPKRCVIRVFSVSGDLIKTLYHDEGYNGSDARWYSTYSDPERTVFSGGEHAWDLLSDYAQIIARGTYFFTVEDLETGHIWKEKFVVIK